MSKDRKRGSGSGYQRDGTFERDFWKKYDLKVRERGIRGGLRRASIGAGGIALIHLINAMKNDGRDVLI